MRWCGHWKRRCVDMECRLVVLRLLQPTRHTGLRLGIRYSSPQFAAPIALHPAHHPPIHLDGHEVVEVVGPEQRHPVVVVTQRDERVQEGLAGDEVPGMTSYGKAMRLMGRVRRWGWRGAGGRGEVRALTSLPQSLPGCIRESQSLQGQHTVLSSASGAP